MQPDPFVLWLATTPLAWMLPYISIVVVACSALDASLPQPAAGSGWLVVRKIISFIALNLGNASNNGQPPLLTVLDRLLADYLARQQQVVQSAEAPKSVGLTPIPPSNG